MVKMKTFINFNLLSSYNVKRRVAEHKDQFGDLKYLGLDPDPGVHVSLPLTLWSHLTTLSTFPLQ